MGSSLLNSKVAPVVDRALAAIKLGTKAFKFTKIQLGNAKPQLNNIRWNFILRGLFSYFIMAELSSPKLVLIE